MVRLGDPCLIVCDHCQYTLISLRVPPDCVLWVVPHTLLECPQCGFLTEFSDNIKLFQPPKEN